MSKHAEGRYILIQFSSSPDAVKEIERRLRVTDMVIKFITVRIDEKQKKIDKRKKAREKRAARRPAPQVAAPACSGGNSGRAWSGTRGSWSSRASWRRQPAAASSSRCTGCTPPLTPVVAVEETKG